MAKIQLSWLEMFSQLKKYSVLNGHANVPARSGRLGNWCCKQRNDYKKGNLTSDQINDLEKINFQFTRIVQWEKMFDELKKYIASNGHANVPANKSKLGIWCHAQRCRYKKGILIKERIKYLEKIGFDFKPCKQPMRWGKTFAELNEYFILNGHSDVPNLYGKLGSWCGTQRKKYKNGTLSSEKIEQLKKINFKFNVYYESWWKMYNELQYYHSNNGHTNIPDRSSKLALWCTKQRHCFKIAKLSTDKINALLLINFRLQSKTPSSKLAQKTEPLLKKCRYCNKGLPHPPEWCAQQNEKPERKQSVKF